MRYKNEKLQRSSHTEISVARIAVCRRARRLGFVVMGLWNWLMPSLFGLKLISYWQAMGLLILSKILFGGLRGPRGRSGYRLHGMRERWKQRTPEEREKFRQDFRTCWSRMTSPDPKPTA